MAAPLRVLIVGGGIAALEATLALRELAEDQVEIELLAPGEEFVYRPMSVAEPFQQGEMRRFPLARLVELAGARLTRGTLSTVDLDGRRATTSDGAELDWDVILLALGMRTREGVPGSLTFRGPDDNQALIELMEDALAGRVRSLTFALPARTAWPLPLYELALMAKVRLEDAGATEVEVGVVTPEAEPLAVFGRTASAEVKELLESRRVDLRTHTTPVVFRSGALVVVPGRAIRTDRVVSVPVPEAHRIPGIPDGRSGFVHTDAHARVAGRADVYAVGDMTTFPVKQGGIAAQQADAAAEAIAALAGAQITPQPFRPVLRGVLLTGMSPRFMVGGVIDSSSQVDTEALFWPPAKVVGRYLAPFLAQHLGLALDFARAR